MKIITLYRYYHYSKHPRKKAERDVNAYWFFWQKATPYKLPGILHEQAIFKNHKCEIYTIGGKDLVWEGGIFDVPNQFKTYLHEIRLFI